MGGREEDQVRARHVLQFQRWFHQALHADGHRSDLKAHFIAEHRVGQNCGAVDLQEDSAMAEPSGMQAGVGPNRRIRMSWRRPDTPRILTG